MTPPSMRDRSASARACAHLPRRLVKVWHGSEAETSAAPDGRPWPAANVRNPERSQRQLLAQPRPVPPGGGAADKRTFLVPENPLRSLSQTRLNV